MYQRPVRIEVPLRNILFSYAMSSPNDRKNRKTYWTQNAPATPLKTCHFLHDDVDSI
jgi:hypothetical protein